MFQPSALRLQKPLLENPGSQRKEALRKDDFSIAEEVGEYHLGKTDAHRSLGSNGMRHLAPRELAEAIASWFSIAFSMIFPIAKICEDGRIASFSAAFKEGKEVGLISVPGPTYSGCRLQAT